MNFIGKLLFILPVESGTGKTGKSWKKRDLVFETTDKYPKKIAVTIWNDAVDQFASAVGQILEVHVNLESREHNGKWYSQIAAWKFGGAVAEKVEPARSFSPPANDTDELPF